MSVDRYSPKKIQLSDNLHSYQRFPQRSHSEDTDHCNPVPKKLTKQIQTEMSQQNTAKESETECTY